MDHAAEREHEIRADSGFNEATALSRGSRYWGFQPKRNRKGFNEATALSRGSRSLLCGLFEPRGLQ